MTPLWQCSACGRAKRISPRYFPLRCSCGARHAAFAPAPAGTRPDPRPRISRDERDRVVVAIVRQAVPDVDEQIEASGMLLGDWVAALTSAVGIPPCGGCADRRVWLNRAHAWVRDRLARR